jgi:hypothetical protein
MKSALVDKPTKRATTRESDRIGTKLLPKATADYKEWRDKLRGHVMGASADQVECTKFLIDLDNKECTLESDLFKALHSERAESMQSLDTKLWNALKHSLTADTEGTRRISSHIKRLAVEFCGRQALKIIDWDYQHATVRQSQGSIVDLLSATLTKNDVKSLEKFTRHWVDDSDLITRSNPTDLPSKHTLGCLFEGAISGVTDLQVQIAKQHWRTVVSKHGVTAETIDVAYDEFIKAMQTRCTEVRNERRIKEANATRRTAAPFPKGGDAKGGKGGKKGKGDKSGKGKDAKRVLRRKVLRIVAEDQV